MTERKEIIGITMDKKTKKKIDTYGEDHALSRSSVIRLAVNDFFIRLEDVT
ncbi:MAG: hypothetical protein KAJ44_01695 [Thermoplasmatales archaeon]|nr:hypothetical protein [Thermoplasmatales archaeon]